MTDTQLKVVMFTDQVKSTTATALRTHAEVSEVSRAQDDLTAEALRLTRGVLLKDTGDGCLALFPSVLEAVRAGVLLQQRVAERNAAQPAERLRFELRVGIDLGDLLVLDNGDLRGEAANRCARVCAACLPGDVYLSDIAARALRRIEVELEKIGPVRLKGLEEEPTTMHRVAALHSPAAGAPNPFIWRGGVTRAEDFFDRENEQRTLRAYLRGRQNCQIVGERRVGKTSLLRQLERAAPVWDDKNRVAYLDLQDPRCFTLGGWLKLTARKFHWPAPAPTLPDFAERVESVIDGGLRPVLCLDEFEELANRRAEFTRDFFLTLRSCGQRGLSIVTASRRRLSQLTDPDDKLVSPFYNTFPLLSLGPFTETDAEDFVNLHRPGVRRFTDEEKRAILDFARGRPLALQVACFNVLESGDTGPADDE